MASDLGPQSEGMERLPLFQDAGFIAQLPPSIPPLPIFRDHIDEALSEPSPSYADAPSLDALQQRLATPVPLYLHALSTRAAPPDTRASWQWWATAAVSLGAVVASVMAYRSWVSR